MRRIFFLAACMVWASGLPQDVPAQFEDLQRRPASQNRRLHRRFDWRGSNTFTLIHRLAALLLTLNPSAPTGQFAFVNPCGRVLLKSLGRDFSHTRPRCEGTASLTAGVYKKGLRVPVMSLGSWDVGNGTPLPMLPYGVKLTMLNGLDLQMRYLLRKRRRLDNATTADLDSAGGSVWPAAADLIGWMSKNEASVRGANVLELGSGTGACGLFAAGLGAAHVHLTDGAHGLLRLMEENLEENRYKLPPTMNVSIGHFWWGKDSAVPVGPGPWDLVIGSDVTYPNSVNPESIDQLAESLAVLLAAEPPPRVVLGHIDRDDSLLRFQKTAEHQGLEIERLEVIGLTTLFEVKRR